MTSFTGMRRAWLRGCVSTSIAAVLLGSGAGVASADPGSLMLLPPEVEADVAPSVGGGGLSLLPGPAATPEAPRADAPVVDPDDDLAGGIPIGRVDPRDRDSDGISNSLEERSGTDPDDIHDRPVDSDGDGTLDALEIEVGTNPLDPNSKPGDMDGDGRFDTSDDDRDGDGVPNDYERRAGTDPNNPNSKPPDSDGDGTSDIQDWNSDTDGDGFSDQAESKAGTDPKDNRSRPGDLDGDGKRDDRDTDMDGDGISNEQERATGHDPRNARDTPPDADGDGVPDARDGSDTDGDGWPDWREAGLGTDPKDTTKHPNGSEPWPYGGNGGLWRPPLGTTDTRFDPGTFGLEVSVNVPAVEQPSVLAPSVEMPSEKSPAEVIVVELPEELGGPIVYEAPSPAPNTGAIGGGLSYEPAEEPVETAPVSQPAPVFQTPWTLGLGGGVSELEAGALLYLGGLY